MTSERPDDEGPVGHPTTSMRAVASSITPLTANDARRRLQRRQRRLTAGALAVALVLAAGLGVRLGQDDREVTTTAGLPTGSVPPVGGTLGTTPGTLPDAEPDGPVGPAPTTTAAPEPPVTSTTPPPSTVDPTPSTAPSAPGSTTPGPSEGPTPTTTPSTTSAPGTVRLAGLLDKKRVELLFATPLCPDQEHRQDGILTFSDGTAWHYETVFCARIDPQNVWHGAGEATLTGPGGAVVTTSWDYATQLPTYGNRYSMRVTRGTGAYAGVSGTCDVSVKLIDGPFYRYDDPDVADPLVCDVVGWPDPAPAPAPTNPAGP